MTEIVSFISRSDPAAFATIMLVQCTLATALALLIANRCKRNSAVQQTVLKAAIACAIFCPAISLAMNVCGLTLISIAVTQDDEQAQKTVLLDSTPAAVPLESIEVEVPDLSTAVIVPEIGPAVDSPKEAVHSPAQEKSPPKPEGTRYRSFRSLLPAVLAIWAIGVLCFIYGIARSWWKLRNILNSTKPIEDPRLVVAANQVKLSLTARNFPRVISSADVKCPVAAGFLHPVIILPEGLCEKLTADELRMVLLREAAHILRRDHLSLLFEQMFLAVYWFHPLSHLLVRRLARAREEVCDNYVLQCVDGPSYSESLLRLTNLLPGLSPVPGGVGLFTLRWKLEERISGLLDDRRKTMLRTNLFTSLTIASLMAFAILPIGVTQLVAQQEAPADTDLQPESFSLETSPASDSKPNDQTAAEETVRVLAIVFADAKKAQEVWNEARQSPTDESFGKLARQYSIDPISREHSGEIPPIRRDNSKPNLERKAFSLRPGEVSSIIQCEDIFVILRRPTSKRSPADVASNIIARVNGEPITIEELEADLVKRYGREHIASLVRRNSNKHAERRISRFLAPISPRKQNAAQRNLD